MGTTLRTLWLAVVVLFHPAVRGQDGLGHDGWPGALTAELKALSDARGVAAQDSVNERVKGVLRQALDAPDAFGRSFAGVPITAVDAPDGRFRLVTWNLARADGSHRFEGMLLVRDGRRQALYELRDMTERTPSPEGPELGPENWYGALYYEVVPVKHGGRTWYTLLGWKGHGRVEARKVIDVLSFRGGRPRFGAPIFEAPPAEGPVPRGRPVPPHRRVFAFSAQARMSLKWDPRNARIVFDHLSPSRPDLAKEPAFTGPDLSYDAYVWEKGMWRLRRDVDARDMEMDRPWNAPPKQGRSKF